MDRTRIRRRLLAAALVAAAAWMAGAPALEGGFVYDDQYYLIENPAVTGQPAGLDEAALPLVPAPGSGRVSWASPLGAEAQALWRPLTVASWRLQWNGPDDPRPLHLGNLALHGLVSLLVLAWGLSLGVGEVAALVGALLFAVHPAHVEAVAWISGRSELLAAACVLAAWIAHLRRAPAWTLAACALVGLGTLAKENAFVAPVLFVAGDLLLRRRPLPKARWLALGATAAAAWILRASQLPQALPVEAPFADVSLPGRIALAAVLAGRALATLAWPGPGRVFHPRAEFLGDQAAWLGPLAALTVALGLALALRRRKPLPAAGILLALVALLPVLQLVPIGATFAARFLYLPSAPLCLAGGVLLADWMRAEARREALGPAPLAALALLGAGLLLARQAARVFHDDLSLWAHEAAVAPEVAHARYNHGYFLDRAGRWNARDRDLPGAADELRTSLELDPDHAYAGLAHQVLGTLALTGAGHRPPDALLAARHYREALRRLPGLFEARVNLAAIALEAPGTVTPAEGLAALVPLEALPLSPERAATVSGLRAGLLEAVEQGDG